MGKGLRDLPWTLKAPFNCSDGLDATRKVKPMVLIAVEDVGNDLTAPTAPISASNFTQAFKD